MATGLLVLGINTSTRLLTYVVGLDKEYLATIRLGVATTTDDAEGEVLATAPSAAVRELEAADIRSQIERLTGDIEQTPSSVSAIKVDGKRAYALVRDGVEVQLKSRPVTVSEFEILDQRAAGTTDGADVLDLDVRVVCSSGTYIRALARDLGAALGVGGHLTALRRTRIGPFSVAEAADLDTTSPRSRASTSGTARSWRSTTCRMPGARLQRSRPTDAWSASSRSRVVAPRRW
jgi:tRNA pseudouridine55 synthase